MNINPLKLRLAISESVRSFKRKLPIVALAAVACYTLHYLETVKKSFDQEKAKPLLIDQRVKDRIAVETAKVGGGEAWLGLRDLVLVDQYSTPAEFINKVIAQIATRMETEKYLETERLKSCISTAIENLRRSDFPEQNNEIINANHAKNRLISNAQSVGSFQTATGDNGELKTCTDQYNVSYSNSFAATESRIANLYRYVRPIDLVAIRKQLDKENQLDPKQKGLVELSLQPILDENQGLYIIYQLLRISCLVIIVFSLIAAIALLLRTVLLSDGVSVFTNHATSLIDMTKTAVLPNVAKAAMASIAAVGIGGAVAAGVAINNKADQALDLHTQGVAEPSRNPNARPKQSGSAKPPTPRDAMDIQYSYIDDHSYLDKSQDFDESAILNKLEALINRPNPPSTVMLDPALSATLTTYLNGNHEPVAPISPEIATKLTTTLETLTNVNKGLAQQLNQLVNPQANDFVKVANHAQPSGTPEALLIKLSEEPINSIVKQLDSLNQRMLDIDKLSKDAGLSNIGDSPIKPAPKRSIFEALFPTSRYFISKRAAEQLRQLITDKDNDLLATQNRKKLEAGSDPAKLDALNSLIKKDSADLEGDEVIKQMILVTYLKGGKPLSEKDFLNDLDGVLQALVTNDAKRSLVRDRFKFWRASFLTYARVA